MQRERGRSSYRSDTLFPRVSQVVHDLLRERNLVDPIEVFIRLGYVRPEQV